MHMSKFKPGTVERNSFSTIGPLAGVECALLEASQKYRFDCSIPAEGPIVGDELF